MSRFTFTSASLFDWSAATASQLNTLFKRIRDWTVSSLGVDSLLPRSVDSEHCAEPITWTLESYNPDIYNGDAGEALAEVFFSPSLETSGFVAIGFVWPRRTDGLFLASTFGDSIEIALYDGNTGTYSTSVYGGVSWAGLWPARCGHDESHLQEPMQGYGIPTHKYGGGECVVTTLSEVGSWVPPGTAVERIGLMGSINPVVEEHNGHALLWAFIEDNGQ